jgi:hypothetical protein
MIKTYVYLIINMIEENLNVWFGSNPFLKLEN